MQRHIAGPAPATGGELAQEGGVGRSGEQADGTTGIDGDAAGHAVRQRLREFEQPASYARAGVVAVGADGGRTVDRQKPGSAFFEAVVPDQVVVLVPSTLPLTIVLPEPSKTKVRLSAGEFAPYTSFNVSVFPAGRLLVTARLLPWITGPVRVSECVPPTVQNWPKATVLAMVRVSSLEMRTGPYSPVAVESDSVPAPAAGVAAENQIDSIGGQHASKRVVPAQRDGRAPEVNRADRPQRHRRAGEPAVADIAADLDVAEIDDWR